MAGFVEWLEQFLHKLPHFNLQFKPLRHGSFFDLDIRGPYFQSLVVFLAFSLIVALLFLCATVIVWIAQCCSARNTEPVRSSRRQIRRLSTCLFMISVICFTLLGVCLYGNEHLNKSLQATVGGLADFNANLRRSMIQSSRLNQTQIQAAAHIDELTLLIEKKSRELPHINQTIIRETDALLTELSDKVDDVKQRIGRLSDVFADVNFLERSQRLGERVEYERWLCCLLLLVIMTFVLFAGVIAFCRQSRKGAIIFSGLGIVIFLVSWLMFSVVFPLTVAYADFCVDSQSFMKSKLNEHLLDSIDFYRTCEPRETHDQTPPSLPVVQINTFYTDIQNAEHKLEGLLFTLFNRSADIENVTSKLSADIGTSFKSIGALESTLSCFNMHPDVQALHDGFCRSGFVGLALISSSLLFLGIFLFILLILVSKSWYIFTRTQSDYLEVGEEDNFSPRGQDAMPDNIYDTNIFNPRARQHLAATAGDNDHRIAGGDLDGFPNGHTPTSRPPPPPSGSANNYHHNGHGLHNNLNNASSPLLTGGDQAGINSWQQQMITHNAALATAPPAALMGTLRGNNPSVSTLNRNGTALRGSANNYQQLNSASNNLYGRYQGRELQDFQDI